MYDNLEQNEKVALLVHEIIIANARDGFRDISGGGKKMMALRRAIHKTLPTASNEKLDEIMQIVVAQHEY